MRIVIFILVSLFIQRVSVAQEFQKKLWKAKKGTIEYFERCESSENDRLVVCLVNDPEGKFDLLNDIAVVQRACLLVPAIVDEKSLLILSELLQLPQYQETYGKKISLFIEGSSWIYLKEIEQLNLSGIILNPNTKLKANRTDNFRNEMAFVLDHRDSNAFTVKSKLDSLGAWVLRPSVEFNASSNPDEKKQWIVQEFEKVDSLTRIFNDSTQFENLRSQAGLVNEVPEVIRQGKRINLSILIVEQGDLEIRITDLAGKDVYLNKNFRAKGMVRLEIGTNSFDWGVYRLNITSKSIKEQHKFMIRG